jgi:hypothetical protein
MKREIPKDQWAIPETAKAGDEVANVQTRDGVLRVIGIYRIIKLAATRVEINMSERDKTWTRDRGEPYGSRHLGSGRLVMATNEHRQMFTDLQRKQAEERAEREQFAADRQAREQANAEARLRFWARRIVQEPYLSESSVGALLREFANTIGGDLTAELSEEEKGND